MKKQFILSIFVILLIVIFSVGGAYAFFSAVFKTDNVTTNSADFSINYQNGTNITGPLTLSTDRTGGLNTTVSVKLNNDSVKGTTFNLHLNIETLTSNLAIEHFKWEVVGVKGGSTVYTNSGNFLGKSSTSPNNKILLVDNYALTTENTTFTVYFWINGEYVDNSVMNGEFNANISASSGVVTGKLS